MMKRRFLLASLAAWVLAPALASAQIFGGAGAKLISGTFVASFDDACTTTPTITFDYVAVVAGNFGIVSLKTVGQSGFPCTGDSTGFMTTGAPIPAAVRMAGSQAWWFQIDGLSNNGVATTGCLSINAAGNMAFTTYVGLVCANFGSGWTASGSRDQNTGGSHPLALTYLIGDP